MSSSTALTDRLLTVLQQISLAEQPISLPELGRRLPIPKPTLHRLVRTLEEQGYLTRTLDGRSLMPGHGLVKMSIGVLQSRLAASAVHETLAQLSTRVGETCNLVMLDGHKVRYVDRVETSWPLRLSFQIGQYIPIHCTATGKLLLAMQPRSRRNQLLDLVKLERLTEHTITDREQLQQELERIRERGYSTDNEEFLSAMVAVAVPIIPRSGPSIVAVSVHAPTNRCSLSDVIGFLPDIKDTAERMARSQDL